MTRILREALVAVLVLACGPLLAQDAVRAETEGSGVPTDSGEGGHGLAGFVIGAAAGIAVGFGVATASDFALKEGGGFGVILLGGGLGGFVGHKVGSSVGRPWQDPGRIQARLDYALTASAASRSIQAAFEESGFPATNQHHPTAPSFSVTYGVGERFNTGLEVSGIPGQWFRASDPGTHLSQTVGGQTYGVFVSYAPMPTEHRRLTYALGAGLDHYTVTVESYFDPILDTGYPEEQPSRASRSRNTKLGLQLRGSLEYWLVHDVSLRVSLVGRWVRPIEVQGITLTHPLPDRSRSLGTHSVDLSSIHLSIGVGMRF